MAARLETAALDTFEAQLAEVFAEMSDLFGIAAMGECNVDPDAGVTWYDPDATTFDEMVAMITMLESGLGATGPYSVMAPSGRPGMAMPALPDSFAHHLAILAGDPDGFTVEQTSILGLFAAAVSAARRRVETLRSLEWQVRKQDVLSRIAAEAVLDDAEVLHRILRIVKDEFDLGSATVWLAEGELLRLVESSETGETRHVERGVTASFDHRRLDALAAVGEAVIAVGDSNQSEPSPFDPELPVLVVPVMGADGAIGVLAFIDPGPIGREIAASVARSAEKILKRRRSFDDLEARTRTEQFMRWVASRVGQTTHDAEFELLDEVLNGLNGRYELGGSSVWILDDAGENFVRRRGRWADGSLIEATGVAPAQAFAVDTFRARGYGVLKHRHLDPIEGDFAEPGDSMLVVPLGEAGTADGILVMMGAATRHWDDATISAARTIGLVLQQGMARFDVEREVAHRLELTQLTQRISGRAVEVRPQNVAEIIPEILRECAEFFELAEAQVWRLEDEMAILRYSHRPDGGTGQIGLEVPYPLAAVGEGRGSVSMRLDEAGEHYGGEHRDPGSSTVVATTYAAAGTPLGVLVFVDPSARVWTTDELETVRTIADTVGQIRSQMLVARRFDRQQRLERILNESASAFVDAKRDTVVDVVDAALDKLRHHLGCDSVAVFELDPDTLDIVCNCESFRTEDSRQSVYAPMHRDDPVVARILDPDHGMRWRFADLIGLPDGLDQTSMLVAPIVKGRDIVIISATSRFGEPFVEDAEVALQSMAALLAQLRSRLLLERSTELSSRTDRLIGEIAADFVERSIEDVSEGIQLALQSVGELFGLRSVSLWQGDGGGWIDRSNHWTRDEDHPPSPAFDRIDAQSPVMAAIEAGGGDILVTEPSRLDVGPALPEGTLTFAPIVENGVLRGGLGTTDNRPLHVVADIEILRDLLEAMAHLVRQLWRRLDADGEIGRKLASEDLLRQFATSLATTPSTDHGGAAEAFGWIASRFGIDHASLWRAGIRPDGNTAELRMQYGATPELRIADRHHVIDLEPGEHFGELMAAGHAEFSIDDEHPVAEVARRILPDDQPRRIHVLADTDESRLLYSLPGDRPVPDHVRATMSTVLSTVVQHEARMAAERAFASAFSSAPVAICLRDHTSRLLSCNQAYLGLTGRSEEELIDSALDLVVSPEHVHATEQELANLALGEQAVRELAYRRADGGIVWARVRTTPVEIPGRSGPVFFMYSEDITESRRSRQLLEYQATHDELTGLPNRRSFVADVSAELSVGQEFAVIILDLDRFKLVNDSLGHPAGDQLLITCADRIRLSLRPGDLVCRLGGDEFAILLRSPADVASASVVADRLLGLLSEPVRVGDEEVFPSASIGIAVPADGDGVDELMRHADAAMYQAKSQGRDRWVRFDRSMRDAVVERIRTETDLRRAIENGQLEVHYQPEFMLDTGEIVGAEALVRWRHPERGLLAAGTFISLAEETGLVVDVGRWVLGQATMQVAAWVKAGHDIIVRVNLSARQLRTAVVGEVKQALAAANLAPERLCLELTETAIMDDVQESARILQEFRDLGVLVAIDDFGTGFSSLAYLKRFPVDILKIDRTFVDGVGVDPDDTAIVRSIIGLARTLRLDVVAEGIEDPTQIAELVRLGCARGQGFHLARPVPPDDVAMLLAGTPTAD
ncbi:MAG: EAL domain-containing protein [Actinomycetota bacterium]